MKLAIVGQGQLADVTARCCEPYFQRFHPAEADVLWVCYDTPLDERGWPNVEWVLHHLHRDLTSLPTDAYIVLSSQLPVGTTARLEAAYPTRHFAYIPENIRVAHGVDDFTHQARIVVGRRDLSIDTTLQILLSPFCGNLIFTDPETAEMVKHVTNAYHALGIAFMNEIDRLAQVVKADSDTIAYALSFDPRVAAIKRPGAPYGGGHLARDLHVLNDLIQAHDIHAPILQSIEVSNHAR